MAKFYSQLNDTLKEFILEQQLFFTASAANTGRINMSPKGLDCLQIVDNNNLAYLDLTGSGNETSAHVLENKRLSFMFCSFGKVPQILRLYGTGEVILPNHQQWHELIEGFKNYTGIRQIIKLHIESLQTSCGFGVPLFEFTGQRDTLIKWAENKGPQGLSDYQATENVASIDGEPTHLGENLLSNN